MCLLMHPKYVNIKLELRARGEAPQLTSLAKSFRTSIALVAAGSEGSRAEPWQAAIRILRHSGPGLTEGSIGTILIRISIKIASLAVDTIDIVNGPCIGQFLTHGHSRIGREEAGDRLREGMQALVESRFHEILARSRSKAEILIIADTLCM